MKKTRISQFYFEIIRIQFLKTLLSPTSEIFESPNPNSKSPTPWLTLLIVYFSPRLQLLYFKIFRRKFVPKVQTLRAGRNELSNWSVISINDRQDPRRIYRRICKQRICIQRADMLTSYWFTSEEDKSFAFNIACHVSWRYSQISILSEVNNVYELPYGPHSRASILSTVIFFTTAIVIYGEQTRVCKKHMQENS
jgi:hypothetical protein